MSVFLLHNYVSILYFVQADLWNSVFLCLFFYKGGSVRSECPHCKCSMDFPDSMTGTLIECPSCSNLFHLMEVRMTCPICKQPQTPGDFVCVKCGFDNRSGRTIQTSYDVSLEGLPFYHRFLWHCKSLMPGLFCIINVLVFILAFPFAMTLIFMGLIFIAADLVVFGLPMLTAGGIIYFHSLAFIFTNEHSLAAFSVLKKLNLHQEILFYAFLFAPLFLFIVINYLGRLFRGLH